MFCYTFPGLKISKAGIIPVNLKRKLSYKNIHLVKYVSVTKIMKALSTLKVLGNEYYQFFPHTEDFEIKCRVSGY